MSNLFVYGSLMNARVVTKIIGRVPTELNANLHGFQRFKVVGEIYPAIIRKSSSQVIGILYENLSDGELKALDAFEGIEYCRVEVSVSSDHIVRPTTSKNSILTAFTYLWNGEVEKLQGEWTYEIDFLPYEQQFFPDL